MADAVKFLEAQDLSVLANPIVLETHPSWPNALCCYGCCSLFSTLGFAALVSPIGVCCASTLAKHNHFQLDHNSIRVKSAQNDCCCHIAHFDKIVPLERVQEVQLKEDCMLSLCGLKSVNVETAAGCNAEVEAMWLANPEQARDIIQLAARLARNAAATAPTAQAGMQRTGGGIAGRLQSLEALVRRGALTADEAARIRVGVLASEQDPLERLVDAANALDSTLITPADFGQLKQLIIGRLARPQ